MSNILDNHIKIHDNGWVCELVDYEIASASEEEAREMNPGYFFVFPWHFKEFILNKEKFNKNKKIPLLFPLPSIEII